MNNTFAFLLSKIMPSGCVVLRQLLTVKSDPPRKNFETPKFRKAKWPSNETSCSCKFPRVYQFTNSTISSYQTWPKWREKPFQCSCSY